MTTKPTLDEALKAWGTADPLTAAGDSAVLDRILNHADAVASAPPAPRHRWWMLGGAVAASVAIALLLAPSFGGRQPQSGTDAEPGAAPVILADASGDDSAAFALLYTPTSDEEYQL